MKKGLILLNLFCSSFLHIQAELDSLAKVKLQTQVQLDLLIIWTIIILNLELE